MLPKEELYCLSDQMKRAAISIPSNIAEGWGRMSRKDYIHFLSYARGSCYELETQLLLCIDLVYVEYDQISETINLCREISAMINSIIAKLSNKDN